MKKLLSISILLIFIPLSLMAQQPALNPMFLIEWLITFIVYGTGFILAALLYKKKPGNKSSAAIGCLTLFFCFLCILLSMYWWHYLSVSTHKAKVLVLIILGFLPLPIVIIGKIKNDYKKEQLIKK